MLRLMMCFLVMVLLSCGGGEKKGTAPGVGRQTSDSAEAKRALDGLETELVEGGGLSVENVRIDADSLHATLRLSDSAVKTWQEAEKTLGRPPSLTWATVSARIYRGGEMLATHSMRFGQVRKLSPSMPSITVALARKAARSGGAPAQVLPPDGDAQCTVLGVSIQ